MEYKRPMREKSLGATYSPKEVHYWKPPCSCGVELGEALEVEGASRTKTKGEVHFWRPPCSCGVSLDEVAE
jgi:hypothetical protein